MSASDEEQTPKAPPRSDVDPGVELEVEGGTLVWKDPVASGEPVLGAYIWPITAYLLLAVGLWVLL